MNVGDDCEVHACTGNTVTIAVDRKRLVPVLCAFPSCCTAVTGMLDRAQPSRGPLRDAPEIKVPLDFKGLGPVAATGQHRGLGTDERPTWQAKNRSFPAWRAATRGPCSSLPAKRIRSIR